MDIGTTEFEELFSERFAYEYGGDLYAGRYYLESFHPDDRGLMAMIRKRFADYLATAAGNGTFVRPLDIHLDYINRPDFNACAWKVIEPELYLIGLNAGLMLRLRGIFNTILARTPVFSDVSPLPDSEIGTVDTAAILGVDLVAAPRYCRAPADPQRTYIAAACYQVALEYIFFHELAHVANGHVDRCLRVNPRAMALGERDAYTQGDLPRAERQSMELDADDTAVWWCVGHFRRGDSPVLSRGPFKLDEVAYLRILMFSLGTVVHCFGGIQKRVLASSSDEYPHDEVRYNIMYSLVMNLLAADADESLREAVVAGVMEARFACDAHFPSRGFPNSFDPENRTQNVKRVLRAQYDELLRHRDDWRPFRLRRASD